MRRLAALILIGAAVLGTAVAAGAGQETPQGRFSSPERAVAGAPIWVRSITPCPVKDGAYQFVRVGISPQGEPDQLTYVESTDSDLAADGSWEVTLSAPSEMGKGINKSYEIQAQCLENEAPYAAPDRVPDTTTTLPPEFSYFRYFYNRLYVTGFDSSDATPTGGDADTTSTSTVESTTSTTSLSVPTTIGTSSFDGEAATSGSALSRKRSLVDDAARIAEIRKELEASGVDTSSMSDVEVLHLEPVSATTSPSSGGIPWWAFAFAAMLAVGTVVGFGARRRSSALL